MKLKTAILERDGWACYLCGGRAEQVDHIRPLKEGGAPWASENLAAICFDCHDAKSKAEARRGSERYRERIRQAKNGA